MDNIKLFPIQAGPVATNGYMVADVQAGVSVVVDVPLGSADFFLETAQREGTPIQAILLTHSHWDHTGDAPALKRATNALVYIHPDDEYRLPEPNKHISFPIPYTFEPLAADRHFRHGDTYSAGSATFEIRHTPGHTEGGVCLIEHTANIAIVGDTLFAGSIGRTDLAGGDTETLLRSIREQLFTLPDDMMCLPGHGEYTTIGTERRSNPFLQE